MAAAPITRELLGNTFTFTSDCFSVTSSGGNVHRRHSPSELRDHFDAGEDRPAHWYEAQLRHYQLPPSKVKSTAKLRLMDAVRRGDLDVPGEFFKLERDMRREWIKASRAGAGIARSTAPKKRKAAVAAVGDDDDDDSGDPTDFHVKVTGAGGREVSVTVSSAASSLAPAKRPAATAAKKIKTEPKTVTTPASKIKKKPKADTAPAVKKKAAPKKPAAAASTRPAEDAKLPPRLGLSDNSSFKPRPEPSSRKQLAGRTKLTDRKSLACPSIFPTQEASPSRGESSTSISGAPYVVPKPPASSRKRLGCRTNQTARKSIGRRRSNPTGKFGYIDEFDGFGINSRDQGYDDNLNEDLDSHDDECHSERYDENHNDYEDDDNEPPPPYPGSPRPQPDRMGWTPTPQANRASAPLGLLNGRYDIVHSDTPPGYSSADAQNSQNMTLTLDGDALWMWFNLGFLEGVGRTTRRPYDNSRRRTFGWVGYSRHYCEVFPSGQGGGGEDGTMDARLEFVGGGVVLGEVDWVNRQTTRFEAQRVHGQGTRSDLSAREMRDLFDHLKQASA